MSAGAGGSWLTKPLAALSTGALLGDVGQRRVEFHGGKTGQIAQEVEVGKRVLKGLRAHLSGG